MKKTSKILLVLGVLLISTTLVSAALLQYFGQVNTTMNVKQSIQVGDQQGWYNYNQPITRNIGDVVHCTDYCYKLLIKNQACKDATVSLTDACTASPVWTDGWDSAGIDIGQYVFGDTQTIELRYKDAQWNVVDEDTAWADITFNTCGTTFDYSIEHFGLQGDYSLVYYIDQDPRFQVWGKVFVIDELFFTGDGIDSNSLQIPTMPYADDYNAGNTGAYPTYDHTSGAKLWLVPTENVENGQLVTWTPEQYLFETDLALFLDCNNWTPYCLPYVFPQFDTTILKAESTYCWISCYHVAFDIVPGTYTFQTIVDAAEIVV